MVTLAKVAIVLVTVVVVLLICILVPLGYSPLEYYEYGFVRRKSTGVVYTEDTLAMGLYFTGPDFTFKKFQADAHFVDLKGVTVFTFNRLEVKLSAHFQYFLRREDLARLHQQFDIYYKDVMKSSAVDALKQAATVFEVKDMYLSRDVVEETLFKAVRERLGGTCCLIGYNCEVLVNDTLCENCIPRLNCQDSDKGIYADVKYFQLGEVEIPHTVKERLLEALILTEAEEKEQLFQDAQVVRKQTDLLVEKIQNDAKIISQNATAQSQLIGTISQANYTAEIEQARSVGLNTLFNALGITTQEHKNSIDYLRVLRGSENIHFTVDFQQRIVGGITKN